MRSFFVDRGLLVLQSWRCPHNAVAHAVPFFSRGGGGGAQVFRHCSAGDAQKGQASVYATHPVRFHPDAGAEGLEEDWSGLLEGTVQ